jgi:hypothetical protein
MMAFLKRLLFPPPAVIEDETLEWLDREERRQMEEVRDRLDRVRDQLLTIDRRRHERPTQW